MNEEFAENVAEDLARGKVLELAEIYALDALTENERNEIEQFLENSSPELKDQFESRVGKARKVLFSAYGSSEMAPPEDLFAKIQVHISSVPLASQQASQEPVSQDSVSQHLKTDQPQQAPQLQSTVEPKPVAESQLVDELSQRRRARNQTAAHPGQGQTASGTSRRWRNWIVAGVAAAALVIAGAIGINALSVPRDSVTAIQQASDARTETAQIQGGGSVTVTFSQSMNSAALTMKDVASPAQGDAYQLWLVLGDGSAPRSLGLMHDSNELSKPLAVKDLNGGAALAITVEPSRGSPAPTTTPIVKVDLKA